MPLSPLNANPDKAMRAADKLEGIINRYIHEMSHEEIAHAYFLLDNAMAALLLINGTYQHAKYLLIEYLEMVCDKRIRY